MTCLMGRTDIIYMLLPGMTPRRDSAVRAFPLTLSPQPVSGQQELHMTLGKTLKGALAGALLLAASSLSAAPPSLGGMWDAIVVVNKTEIPFRFEIAGDGASVRGWFFDGDLKMSSTRGDRKSTRLNSSHLGISYAVFCLKKKK